MLLPLLCLALALAAGAVPFLAGTVYYMVADDYLLNYIANGSYGTAFSDHLMFLKMPAGWLLARLYGLTDRVNWYFLLVLSTLLLSFAILHFCVWVRTRSPFYLAVTVLMNAAAVRWFLSYTVSGFLLAGAACALFGVTITKERWRRTVPPWCALLAFMGWCMRGQALSVSLLLVLPVPLLFMWRAVRDRQGEGERWGNALRQVLTPCLLPAVLFVLLMAGGLLWEKQAYSGDGWSAYKTYNHARSALVDSYMPPWQQVAKDLKAEGLTQLDYSLAGNWKYCERSVFTEEKLLKAAAICREHTTLENRLSYMKDLAAPGLVLFLLLPWLLLLLLPAAGRLAQPLPAALTALMGSGVLFLLAFYRMRFVMRVAVPVLLLSFFAVLLVGTAGKGGGPAAEAGSGEGKACLRRRQIADGAACVLTLAALILFLRYFQERNQVNRIHCEQEPLAALTQEITAHPETLYVMDAAVLSHQFYFGTPAARVSRTDLFRHVARSGSWDSYSPRYDWQMEGFVSDPENLLTAIVKEPDVVYVSMGGCGDIASFYEEQTGRKAVYEGEAYPGLGVTVWTLREKS